MIIREIHLIDNLKIDFFIDNHILSLELIDISTSINFAYIENCEITVLICFRAKSNLQSKFAHNTKIVIFFSQKKIVVFIHVIFVSKRDYIFEFDQINFAIHVYIINVDIKTILIKNDNHTFIKIFRNFRFNKITKIMYFDVYFVNSVFKIFVVKHSKASHKKSWFKKILKAHIIITHLIELTDTVLFNEIIIHSFSNNVVNAFFLIDIEIF